MAELNVSASAFFYLDGQNLVRARVTVTVSNENGAARQNLALSMRWNICPEREYAARTREHGASAREGGAEPWAAR